MANIQIRVNDTLKNDAQAIANDMGIDVATAVRMFLTQMVKVKGLPFQPIADPFYSAANQRYLERAAEEIKKGVNIVHHDIIED